VSDAQFRRALMHGLNRQEMVDTFMGGLTQIAHSYLAPNEAIYKDVESQIVKYDYDTRRAAQMIDGLGYTKASDGVYQDSAGRKLEVEVRTTAGDDTRAKLQLAIADQWQQLGVAVHPEVVPRQRASDRDYRATFPGFELSQRPNQMSVIGNLHSNQSPLPENDYTGNNVARYQNREFDALIDRYYVTIGPRDRTQIVGQIMNHLTSQVLIMGIFYTIEPVLVSNRMVNLTARHSRSTHAWNAHEWNLQ
jgi:peptide/nickel transport system substrate-binding protein